MQLYLNHTPKKPDFEINHTHKIALIGSCFAENIGILLNNYKFNTLLNPNGILFNPKSILSCITPNILAKEYDNSLLIKRGNLYFSYLHHSYVYANSESELIAKINETNLHTQYFLKQANFLMITFGSAYVYYHTQLNQTVANCHKQPANLFEKKLLTVTDIVNDYISAITKIQGLHPNLKLIFTVSPVKYLKDGVEENFISKSTLRIAINDIISQTKNCFYFPAYELVTDDLRDYRFYKEDLAHPNQQAINYVWQKFNETYFGIQTQEINQHITKLNLATNHRFLHNDEKEITKHNDYILKLKEKLSIEHNLNP
jgi:hypothetical protein